mmetsp:Transcript_5485/g.11361  ORF Transcript_5485/g.11361 Transcript_5485/m.11361 type:complete len:119 (+) Transcript_5485:71-427(+)
MVPRAENGLHRFLQVPLNTEYVHTIAHIFFSRVKLSTEQIRVRPRKPVAFDRQTRLRHSKWWKSIYRTLWELRFLSKADGFLVTPPPANLAHSKMPSNIYGCCDVYLEELPALSWTSR